MKANYAILRFAKYKGPAVGKIEGHNERTKKSYASNPDIDPERSPMNFHLVTPAGRYRREIDRQVKEATCRVRKDSVLMVEALITATPEFFQEKSQTEVREFFQHALSFITKRQDPETILSAVVHMDEKTPHMHLCFVPLTKDHRLSAKDIMGNRKTLIKWQDDFWSHMSAKYPDLERGEAAEATGREHIPPRLFKEMNRLTKQKEEINSLLDGINPFNALGRAEKLKELLVKYVPGVERMARQLKKFDAGFRKLSAENRKLKKENDDLRQKLNAKEHESVLKQMSDLKLKRDYEEAKAILDRIPPDILKAYSGRTQERRRDYDQSL